jgi:hypothetical protein
VLRKPLLAALLLPFCLLCAGVASAQQQASHIEIIVVDQNDAVLPGTVVTLLSDGSGIASAQTDFSGKVWFSAPPGQFTIQAEKKGFYVAKSDLVAVAPGQSTSVEVRLQQYQQFSEHLDVVAQPSPIDLQQTSSAQQISGDEIVDIPYPTTRDYRNVLPFIPGVIQDSAGQPHIAGGNTPQTLFYLDGFEASQPAAGALVLRVSPDSLTRINVETSRYSAQYGKSSSGVLTLDTQSGDNKFRYSFVDFIPTLQNVNGIHFNNWTPRGSFSGPLLKDKLWFYSSFEDEYDLNLIKQQAASNPVWRTDQLFKLQYSLTARNIVSAFGLLNTFDSDRNGLSAFVPPQTTQDSRQSNLFSGVKDDLLLPNNSLLEAGFAVQRFQNSDRPLSNAPFFITPFGETGGAFEFDNERSSRTQGFANYSLTPFKWFGRHEFRVGLQGDEVRESTLFVRSTASTVDQNNVLTRQAAFQNVPRFDQGLTEAGAYLQDRWNVSDRIVAEAGVRFDRDSFVRDVLTSPRVGGSFLLQKSSETKISAGIGRYYDRTILDLTTQPVQGSRTDLFFNPDGTLSQPPITTSFIANRVGAQAPRFLNWSASLERKLPWGIYGRVDYLNRSGSRLFVYDPTPQTETFQLTNNRTENYRAITVAARKEWLRGYPVFLSYTRSAAHANQILDFSVDNLVFGPQVAGPLPWDAPNQLVSWGWLPLHFWKLDFAYSALWRSGFPFLAVNNQNALVPSAGFFRFPDFVMIDPAIERKFTFHHYLFAVRVGINNITNNENPSSVINDIQSPAFRSFSGFGRRTLNGRIRLLGRN